MPALPRVLIVDYDPRVLRSLSELFSESGYQVDTAKDGPAALAMFNETHPDAVLLEAMIPKKHGFEVCQEIKKSPQGKNTPVIIMTAVYKGRKYRSQAMHVHGCDEYVEKPCAPEAILEILRRMVPPGPVAQPVGAGAASAKSAAAKQGQLIPFPTRTPGEDSSMEGIGEAELEIMSKLDEILPNTPVFDERGFGNAMVFGSSQDQALEYGAVDDESIGLQTELAAGSDIASEPVTAEAQPTEMPRQDTSRSAVIDAEYASPEETHGKPKRARSAEDANRHTRARRRKPAADTEAQRGIPKWMIVVGGLGAIILAASYFLTRL